MKRFRISALLLTALLAFPAVLCGYSKEHFDPAKVPFGTPRWVPNGAVWSKQPGQIKFAFVRAPSFPGGRALKLDFPAAEDAQAIHVRLDAAPQGSDCVMFFLKLEKGAQLNTADFSQKDAAQTESFFRAPAPRLKEGETTLVVIPFSAIQYTCTYVPPQSRQTAKPENGDRLFTTGRPTGMNLYLPVRQASSFLLGQVLYGKMDQLPRLPAGVAVKKVSAPQPPKNASRNLMVWDPDFETGDSGFTAMNMRKKAAIVPDGFESEQSLLIPCDVTSSLIPGVIRSNTHYMLSFYVKGKPGTQGRVSVHSFHWRWCGGRPFPLTGQWQRVTLRILPYPDAHPSHRIIFHTEGAPYQVDRIQLEEGKTVSPFVSPAPVLLNATTGRPAGIVTTRELPVMIRGRVLFTEGAKTNTRLTFCCQEQKVASISLPPGVKKYDFQFSCPFAGTPGYYPCRVTLADPQKQVLAEQYVPFVVTAPFTVPGDYYGIMSGEIELDALRRMGASVLRNNLEIWKYREQNGPRAAKPHEIARETWYGKDFRFLATLYNLAEIPPWARRPGSNYADPARFAGYVERLLDRQQKGITWLEMDNEIDSTFVTLLGIPRNEVVKVYGDLLKAAHPVAQKRGVKLAVSPCTGIEFAEQLFKYAHESFDLYAAHPYVFPRTIAPDGRPCANPETGGFLKRMDDITRVIRQYGNKHELAVGELGWNMTTDSGYGSRAALIQASYLARVAILLRTYPECRWSIWYTITHNSGTTDYGIFRLDNGMRPLPAVAAFAEAAHRFQGMTGGRAQRLVDDDPHYLVSWSLGGERRFALWTTDEWAEPLYLSIPQVKAYDLFGKPLDPKRIPYTFAPVYLAVPEAEGDAAAETIRQTLETMRPCTVHASLAAENQVLLQLRANGKKARKITFELGNHKKTVTVQPKVTTAFTLPYQGGNTAELKITGTGRTLVQKLHFPVMTGVPFRSSAADWRTWDFTRAANCVTLDKRSDVQPPDAVPWKGPADLSAKVTLCYDDTAFYLFAAVRDDLLETKGEGRSIWQGDCIQFALDPQNDAIPRTKSDNDYEYGSAYGKKPWCWRHPENRTGGAEYEELVTRQGDLTLYRLRVPWAKLAPLGPQPGRVFGFALVVNDCDKGRAQFRLEYGHGIASHKDPASFLKMKLLPQNTP